MTKRKVFLLADIGQGFNGYYHVGDEAMFLSNLEEYRKKGIEVFASSRSISHPELKNHEVLDVYILSLLHFIKLLISALILRAFNIDLFPRFFRKTIKTLKNCDILHVSGGGNVTSLWPGHIYYRSLMIIIAKLYDKKIIITSQSLGPITTKSHKLILGSVLNKTNYLGIRDKHYSIKTIQNLKVSQNIIHFNYDDALFWPTHIQTGKKPNKIIKVGISLHDPHNLEIKSEIEYFLRKLISTHQNIKLFFIPHVLDFRNGYDIKFAESIAKNLNTEMYQIYNGKYFLKEKKYSIAKQVKQLTSKMDFVIASRYHGLVFAISASKPCLAINYDKDYYKGKNTGFLELFFKKPSDFVVDFNHLKSDHILSKFDNIYKERKSIEKNLKKSLIKAYEENQKTKDNIYRLEWDSI